MNAVLFNVRRIDTSESFFILYLSKLNFIFNVFPFNLHQESQFETVFSRDDNVTDHQDIQ